MGDGFSAKSAKRFAEQDYNAAQFSGVVLSSIALTKNPIKREAVLPLPEKPIPKRENYYSDESHREAEYIYNEFSPQDALRLARIDAEYAKINNILISDIGYSLSPPEPVEVPKVSKMSYEKVRLGKVPYDRNEAYDTREARIKGYKQTYLAMGYSDYDARTFSKEDNYLD